MIGRHIFDARHVKAALAFALGLYGEVSEHFSDPSGIAAFLEIQGLSDFSVEISAEGLEDLDGKLWRLTSSSNFSTDPDSIASLLAEAAIIVSHASLRVSRPPTDSNRLHFIMRRIRTDFAIAYAALLARALRHKIPIGRIPRDQTAVALRNNDRELLVQIFRQSLGMAQPIGGSGNLAGRPIPRAYIATPLTYPDDYSHRMILQLASIISRLLTNYGMVVISPDPDPDPSGATDDLGGELSRQEQLLIMGADLVVAVGAEHASWGVTRSATWAEGCCSIVAVASATTSSIFVSRAPATTFRRTYRQDAKDNHEVLIRNLENILVGVYPLIEGHAQDRIDVSQRIQQALLETCKRLPSLGDAVFEQSLLTRERAIDLMDHPVMINHASLAEIRALRRLLGPPGEPFDAMIDLMLGRESAGSHLSVAGCRELSAQSYSNLCSAAEMEGWNGDDILDLIDAHLNPDLSPQLVYHSSTVTGDDWIRLYRQIWRDGG
jgi:hypothetical protein